MLVIYVENITPRVEYCFNFVFEALLKIPFQLTSDVEAFKSLDGEKLTYGNKAFDGIPMVWSHPLLFENTIEKQHIEIDRSGDVPFIFAIPGQVQSLTKFDPFAAIFFMISRYEEYLVEERDEHGRFQLKSSMAYEHSFYQLAVVERWADELGKALEADIGVVPGKRIFQFNSTLDIDNAFAYREKGVLRTFGAAVKDLLSFNFTSFSERLKVLLLGKKDPYDSFEWIKSIHQKYEVRPIIFWLLGDYGKYDKNISHRNATLHEKIIDSSTFATNGLHPSYHSQHRKSIAEEQNRLNLIVGEKIDIARMHYLNIQLPETYQYLNKNGFSSDYSMGFSEESGFRAGTAQPFNFFDLQRNEATNLLIHPFQIMDSTYMYYKKQHPEDALNPMKTIVEETKKVGGKLYIIFHNESIGTGKRWSGWRNCYEKLFQEVLSN